MKLLKKKVNVFGKSIPVLAIFVLGIALVSAALVPYLSGMITGNFDVISPMKMIISPETPLDGIHGGEFVEYTIIVENLADVPIRGETTINVTNADGITCEDFASIMVGMTTPGTIAPVDILLDSANCWSIDYNSIGLMFGPTIDTYEVGRLDTMEIKATLRQNSLGTYIFNAQILEPTTCEYSVETGTSYAGISGSTVTPVTITNVDCSTVNALKVEHTMSFQQGQAENAPAGWAGWSCLEVGYPNVLGGGVIPADADYLVSMAWESSATIGDYTYPNTPWEYTYVDGEEGWIVEAAGSNPPTSIYALCAA